MNDNQDTAPEYQQWKRKAYDRENLTRKETAALIERSKTASWPSARVWRQHMQRHAGEFGEQQLSLAEYNQRAIDLIRSGKRDVYTSIRNDKLHAVFAEPIATDGKLRYLTAIVEVEANKLLSLHIKDKLQNNVDQIQAFQQPARGIQKWLNIKA